MANDLKVYFRGFEVALKRRNIDDAIRYLTSIKAELNDNLDYLRAEQESTEEKNVLKNILRASLNDYKKRIKRIQRELKKQ
jgi:DNA-binding transcriptional regulator GbsR (MarR family)